MIDEQGVESSSPSDFFGNRVEEIQTDAGVCRIIVRNNAFTFRGENIHERAKCQVCGETKEARDPSVRAVVAESLSHRVQERVVDRDGLAGVSRDGETEDLSEDLIASCVDEAKRDAEQEGSFGTKNPFGFFQGNERQTSWVDALFVDADD